MRVSMKLFAAIMAAGLLAACTPQAAKPAADGRLPEGVTPLHYTLALTIDPRAERFSGVSW